MKQWRQRSEDTSIRHCEWMGVGFSPVSFFSYFTNLSNLIVSLIFAAVALWRREQSSFGDDLVRGAGVVYISVVGLVYIALLRNEDLGPCCPGSTSSCTS